MIAKPIPLALAAVLLLAGAASAAPAARARLEGYWEPPGSDGAKILQQPELNEKGKAAAKAMRDSQDLKDGVSVGSRYCLPLAQPWNLFQSAPIAIVQDDRETTMMFEQHSLPSHIYTDGRDHAEARKLKLQVNGHSIGRWEGDTFVVDTVHFFGSAGSPGGIFPGGVPKSPTSHMVARFTPSADGKMLVGRFTVDDPELLTKPVTWEFTWKRSDPGAYAAAAECDPRNEANSAH